MMKGIIYIYTNALNGKVYIGQTTQEEKARKCQHKTSKDNLPFHCAIRKYGWDNFHYETLKEIYSDSKEDLMLLLNFWEKFYIKEYKSNIIGYNVALGGNNCAFSDLHKLHLKQNHADFKGKNHPQWGTHFSEERKQKLRDCHSIPIVCVSLDGEYICKYKSATEAAIILNFSKSGFGDIRRCCSGELLSCRGYIFLNESDYNEENVSTRVFRIKNPKTNAKSIAQYDIYGNFIRIWKSIREEEEFYKKSKGCIRSAIDKNFRTACGYKWKTIELEVK